ncbi:hypothetical protein PRZ48_004104 [Zasmidium cellare]|uniref:Transmembrane protein n=1 Tax=Zasmidium cellare TaxID=395010 RepID=A0ABR0EWX3_ZASCE|nr:hypothetical protein PRZ48_004104 [Zasmidium cellare]
MASDDDDNQTSMPYQAIIVLCLVGAGAAVLFSWAIFRHFYEADDDRVERGDALDHDGYTQAQYMRIVRLRNQEDLQRKYGGPNYVRPKPVMQHHVQSSVSSF